MLGMFGGAMGQLYLARSLSHLHFRQVLFVCVLVGLLCASLTWGIIRDRPDYLSPTDQKEGSEQSSMRIVL